MFWIFVIIILYVVLVLYFLFVCCSFGFVISWKLVFNIWIWFLWMNVYVCVFVFVCESVSEWLSECFKSECGSGWLEVRWMSVFVCWMCCFIYVCLCMGIQGDECGSVWMSGGMNLMRGVCVWIWLSFFIWYWCVWRVFDVFFLFIVRCWWMCVLLCVCCLILLYNVEIKGIVFWCMRFCLYVVD